MTCCSEDVKQDGLDTTNSYTLYEYEYTFGKLNESYSKKTIREDFNELKNTKRMLAP